MIVPVSGTAHEIYRTGRLRHLFYGEWNCRPANLTHTARLCTMHVEKCIAYRDWLQSHGLFYDI